MRKPSSRWGPILLALLSCALTFPARPARADEGTPSAKPGERRLLYVAVPGIRNYLDYGGHGVLVYDIDDGHKLLRRIPAAGLDGKGEPLNVKGICASVPLKRLYVGTTKTMTCFDLTTDRVVWERAYDGGCDRMAISPDGRTIYMPSFEGPHWTVIGAASGDVLAKIVTDSGAHNTVYGPASGSTWPG